MRVEIIHDALLYEWQSLRDRLHQDRFFQTWRQQIESRVEGWVFTSPNSIGHRDREKLLRGSDLIEAEHWWAERKDDLSIAEREFIFESVALRKDEIARAEEQARKLQAALDRANKELEKSNSQRLAYAAQSLDESESETALLLACEAVKWDHNSLTEQVLRDTLDKNPWQQTSFIGHSETVNGVQFSKSGRQIVTASDDGTARIWDTRGNELIILDARQSAIKSAVFSPDETIILTTSVDSLARVWHSDGQLLSTLECPNRDSLSSGHPFGVFNPNGQNFLVCNWEDVWLWDIQQEIQQISWDARSEIPSSYLLTYEEEALKHRASLKGHNDSILSATFSSDGQHILTASRDKTARVWTISGQQLAILQGHKADVVSAVFSPTNAQLVLTGSDDRTARLWKSDGELLTILEGHKAAVGHLAFSPNGQKILTATDGFGHDYAVRLWDISGKPLAILEGHSSFIQSVTFSPNGQYIVTASSDKTARLWNLEGQTLAVFRGHLGMVTQAVFSPDSQRILTSSTDRTVRLWKDSNSLLPTLEGHEGAVTSAIYSVDGSHILTSSEADNSTRLWHKNGQHLATYRGRADLETKNCLSPDGRYLLTIENNGENHVDFNQQEHVHLWELPFNLQWFDIRANNGSNNGLNDGPKSRDWANRIHDRTEEPIATFTDAFFVSAVFSSTGNHILTSGIRAKLWNKRGELIAQLDGPNLPDVFDEDEIPSIKWVMFSPDGQRVLTASENGMVWLWNIQGELVASFLVAISPMERHFFNTIGYTGPTLSRVVISPNGRRILTTIGPQAYLLDSDGQYLATLTCKTDKVRYVLFSPDSQRIVLVGMPRDSDVSLWDGNGQFIASLSVEAHSWDRMKFDPKSKILCIPVKNIIKFWERNGDELEYITLASDTLIFHVEFSEDGKSLLVATSDGTTQLWQIKPKKKQITTFKGHTDYVTHAIYSGDGKKVLTASHDGTARQFLVHVEDLLDEAVRRAGRRLNDEEVDRFDVHKPIRFDAI